MHANKKTTFIFENSSLDLHKTITSTLDNGGAVTFLLKDAIEFIFYNKYANEKEFLLHLYHTNSLTQNALECFLKHMMFSKDTAKNFVRWQRKKALL
ncbi:hypothetical protein [Sulfurimonas paralvinellae]|uniref:Uncharacterized protein n=1 Tax=Sulfurimonas paralvinellae TaxID=317658 RepID=A0A7M1BCK5_9BACT|nr:hypothetical protein [Sulfurimonas paralvinellae]QOP46538.1 hypothetical protein FM071_09640 [Sulfurimonas paralvinellae]